MRQPGVEAITRSGWYFSNKSEYSCGLYFVWARTKAWRAARLERRIRVASADGIQIPNRNFHVFSAQTSQRWLSMASVLIRHEPPMRRR